MRLLLLTPPMTQINTPYPATAYLTGFLRSRGYDAVQADPAIELLLSLLSLGGLKEIHQEISEKFKTKKLYPASVRNFLKHYEEYHATVDSAVKYLQGT